MKHTNAFEILSSMVNMPEIQPLCTTLHFHKEIFKLILNFLACEYSRRLSVLCIDYKKNLKQNFPRYLAFKLIKIFWVVVSLISMHVL